MKNYTRKQLKERWERAKDNLCSFDGNFSAAMLMQIIPGLWEVSIFPRWFFKRFLDRKIIEAADSAIMSRNVCYAPVTLFWGFLLNSQDTQEWGWFSWMYYFHKEEDCYVLELNYNVEPGDSKPLPLVKGILDVALLESPTSIIGKFKWRSPLLQKIPLIRRIGFIKAHRFLFYFEMKKVEDQDKDSKSWVEGYEFRSFYPYSDYGKEEDKNMIKFPKASESWGKVKLILIADPREEGKCIAIFDTGDGKTFKGRMTNGG